MLGCVWPGDVVESKRMPVLGACVPQRLWEGNHQLTLSPDSHT